MYRMHRRRVPVQVSRLDCLVAQQLITISYTCRISCPFTAGTFAETSHEWWNSWNAAVIRQPSSNRTHSWIFVWTKETFIITARPNGVQEIHNTLVWLLPMQCVWVNRITPYIDLMSTSKIVTTDCCECQRWVNIFWFSCINFVSLILY